MSNVKSMMDEVKTCLRLVRILLLFYCRKLLRVAVRVLLACSKFVVLTLALPPLLPEISRKVIADLATKEEKA